MDRRLQLRQPFVRTNLLAVQLRTEGQFIAMWQSSEDEDNYRKLQQNDTGMTSYTHKHSFISCQELADALRNNNYIISLRLFMEHITTVECEAKPLLEYIRDTTTRLEEIELVYTGTSSPNSQLWILQSIERNACINSVRLWGSFEMMSELLATALSSSKLPSIYVYDRNVSMLCLYMYVLCQKSANKSILKYVNVYVRKENDPTDIQSLLYQLGSHNPLNSLKICGPKYTRLESELSLLVFKTLSVLLQLTRSLCHLSFANIHMTKECLENLASGLTLCAPMERLQFLHCTMDWEASRRILQFLQNENRCKNTDLELEIGETSYLDRVLLQNETIYFANVSPSSIAETLAQPYKCDQSVSFYVSHKALVRALDEFQVTVTSTVPLRFRHVSSIDKCPREHRKALYSCMPHLVYLQSLSLCNESNEEMDCWPFAMAVRSSGSVTTVHNARTRLCTEKLDTSDTPNAYTLVQAYCQRNICVPELLSIAALQQASHPTVMDQVTGDMDMTLLVPLLFAVAKQAPRMAPNTMYRGMLGM